MWHNLPGSLLAEAVGTSGIDVSSNAFLVEAKTDPKDGDTKTSSPISMSSFFVIIFASVSTSRIREGATHFDTSVCFSANKISPPAFMMYVPPS